MHHAIYKQILPIFSVGNKRLLIHGPIRSVYSDKFIATLSVNIRGEYVSVKKKIWKKMNKKMGVSTAITYLFLLCGFLWNAKRYIDFYYAVSHVSR